ncbi:MAG: dihydropteroate synthase [Deltaproteobacteria bacterium]|nr:dihydropteroate synthase [Deltaproteobacteria bacterium]
MAVGGIEVWGVLNVTPDSFYDGGVYAVGDAAISAGARMAGEGADVIDVGGESTRPAGKTYGTGFSGVAVDEELARVVGVVRALASRGLRVSIDTTKAAVAEACLDAGARIVNDVSCAADPALARAAAAAGAEYVVMHRRGSGEVPRDAGEPRDEIVERVVMELRRAAGRVVEAGVAPERIWVDPGIGFSKPPRHSMVLIGAVGALRALGYRVLVGASRKSFIGSVHDAPVERRLGGTLAAVLAAAAAGASALRVHDVEPTVQALAVRDAIARASGEPGHGRTA